MFRPAAPLLGILGMALAYALAAPPLAWWPLAFVTLVPLLHAFEGRSLLARVGIGTAAGASFALAITGLWFRDALITYLGSPASSQLAGLALPALFGGASGACFGALSGIRDPHAPILYALRVACAWTLAEWFRARLLGGLPWLELSHLLAPAPALVQLASVGGATLVSFWLAFCNACVFLILCERDRRTLWRPAAVALGGAAASTAVFIIGTTGTQPAHTLRLALVQPALHEDLRGDTTQLPKILDALIARTRDAGPVDVAVWPENAIPAFLPANDGALIRALASLSVVDTVLLGAPRVGAGTLHNSAWLYRKGLAPESYDKRKLVPLTERRATLLGVELATPALELSAGSAPRAFQVAGASLGPLICFELLFPEIVRAQVQEGASVLVNLSHDGSFGSSGARQHLAAATLRAVEVRRPLVRATSSGMTAALDRWGRTHAELEPGKPGTLVVDVHPSAERPIFLRLGDWVTPVVALLLAGMLLPRRATPLPPR